MVRLHIGGLEKRAVISALYEEALRRAPRLNELGGARRLTPLEEARTAATISAIASYSDSGIFSICGIPLDITFSRLGDEVDVGGYDRMYGDGTAMRVIGVLRRC